MSSLSSRSRVISYTKKGTVRVPFFFGPDSKQAFPSFCYIPVVNRGQSFSSTTAGAIMDYGTATHILESDVLGGIDVRTHGISHELRSS